SREIPYASQADQMIVMAWIMQGIKETVPAGTPSSLAQLIGLCWEERSKRPAAREAVEILEGGEPVSEPVPVPASSSTTSGYRITSEPLKPPLSESNIGYRMASDILPT